MYWQVGVGGLYFGYCVYWDVGVELVEMQDGWVFGCLCGYGWDLVVVVVGGSCQVFVVVGYGLGDGVVVVIIGQVDGVMCCECVDVGLGVGY